MDPVSQEYPPKIISIMLKNGPIYMLFSIFQIPSDENISIVFNNSNQKMKCLSLRNQRIKLRLHILNNFK